MTETGLKCYHIPSGSDGKISDCKGGHLGSIPGLGRSSGEGNGNPLQYSCLENPMDRGDNPWDCIESDMTEQLAPSHTVVSNSFLRSILV